MYDVLFDSLYDSELLNAKGCAQWKIELQLFGKGGSVIVFRELWSDVRLQMIYRITRKTPETDSSNNNITEVVNKN